MHRIMMSLAGAIGAAVSLHGSPASAQAACPVPSPPTAVLTPAPFTGVPPAGGSPVDCTNGNPQPVDGTCGTANGVAASTAPVAGLCSVGMASAVTGTGPWSWTCAGTNGGATASCSAPLAPPPPTTAIMGETAVFTDIDGGNGNLILAQDASLATAGTLRSCSFNVTAIAGQLRLGVYDASGSGGGPGKLLAQTAAFTPVLGWNTQQVLTPVALPIATYWLAYLPSSNNLQFPVERANGFNAYRMFTFGPMPATFPGGGAISGITHWSLYCTLTVP